MMTAPGPSRYWTWKRRRRPLLLLLLLAVLAAVVAAEPAYDCANGRGRDPVISITLNGGPNEWTTPILKVLRGANVVATFFVEPELFASSAALAHVLKQIVADGHTVACHASAARDNDQCRKQLVKVIGYNPVLRRPLTLDDVAGEVGDARANGQVVALWNYDFGDWDSTRSEVDLVQQYRATLAAALNRTSDSGLGIGMRHGSFIIVMQNGDRIVQSFTMPNGAQTTILAEVLSGSPPAYAFVSMADCLKIKAYSAYSTPDQSPLSSNATTSSNTVLFAIVFAGLFGLLAIAAVLYTSARRKLHQKARQKEEQRELSRAAIGVMVSQGLFKGDRRDFEQSIPNIPDDSDELESDAQRLRHLTPNGIVRTPPMMRRTKKDFHDLKTSHYSMAVNPHGRSSAKLKSQPPRIVYGGKQQRPAVVDRRGAARPGPARRVSARHNSDPIFGSVDYDDDVFAVDEMTTSSRPIPVQSDGGGSGVYRPPVRTVPVVLPFQQPFEYGRGADPPPPRRQSTRPLRSGSMHLRSGTFGRRKRRVEDDDDLDADFRQDYVLDVFRSPYI